MRILAAIAALCAIVVFAGWVFLRDNDHWRNGDRRHASRGMVRAAVMALALASGMIGALICSSITAHARPSPFPVTSFEGDKYGARQAQMGADVARDIRRQRAGKRSPVSRKRRDGHPLPKPRPGTVEPLAGALEPLGMGGGMLREAKRVIGRGRPARWCGWWLGQHLGMPFRHLWLARNWADVGSNAGGPRVGAIVVWRHHVGIITGRSDKGWIVKSGNDGRAVRERPRSIAGAIAFRIVGWRG